MKRFDYVILGSSKDVTLYTEKTKKILSYAIPSPKVYNSKIIINAGTLKLPKGMNSENAMLCSSDSTHACHAGTWIHCYKNWEYNEIGDVDFNKLENIWNIAKNLGWKLI